MHHYKLSIQPEFAAPDIAYTDIVGLNSYPFVAGATTSYIGNDAAGKCHLMADPTGLLPGGGNVARLHFSRPQWDGKTAFTDQDSLNFTETIAGPDGNIGLVPGATRWTRCYYYVFSLGADQQTGNWERKLNYFQCRPNNIPPQYVCMDYNGNFWPSYSKVGGGNPIWHGTAVPHDQWFYEEECFIAGTVDPATGFGNPDGYIGFYINGVLLHEFTGVNYWPTAAPSSITVFKRWVFGQQSQDNAGVQNPANASPAWSEYRYIARPAVSTQRIGP